MTDARTMHTICLDGMRNLSAYNVLECVRGGRVSLSRFYLRCCCLTFLCLEWECVGFLLICEIPIDWLATPNDTQ